MIRMHWWLWNIRTISNVSSAIVTIWVDNIISFMNLNLNDKNALVIVKYSNHKQYKQCHCHHLGRSARWSLLPLTPVANIIILLISVIILYLWSSQTSMAAFSVTRVKGPVGDGEVATESRALSIIRIDMSIARWASKHKYPSYHNHWLMKY